jgi:hypothetical protein
MLEEWKRKRRIKKMSKQMTKKVITAYKAKHGKKPGKK